MTIELFMFLLTFGAIVAGLFTEALKKALTNISANVTALIVAVVVGVLGTMAAYVLLDIPFSLKNIICIPMMSICIWMGAMLGYDKVTQSIQSIRR